MKKETTTNLIILALFVALLFQEYTYRHVRLSAKEVKETIENMSLSQYVSVAAVHHRILREHRKGNVEGVTDRLESHIDLALLHASKYLEADPKYGIGAVWTDWNELKMDREKYPRRQTDSQRDEWINKVLDSLIEM